MSQKRRGLGRGLGALIPSSPSGSRPSDVFFEGAPRDERSADQVDGGGSVATAVPTSAATGTAGSLTSSTTAQPAQPPKIRTGEVNEARVDDAPANTAAFGGSNLPVAEEASVSRETDTRSRSLADRDLANTATTEAFGGSDKPLPAIAESQISDNTADDGLLPVPGARFLELDPASIHPNSKQPRLDFDEDDLAELVSSISEVGVLQPVVVRPSRDEVGKYELIMGERRWRATQAAGLDTIPAIVRDTDDEDLLRDALLENLHRSALNPLEEAAAYQQLLDDFGCTHEELSTRIARSRPQISNTLRLLKLPPLVQRRVAAGVLSAGHARALLRLDDAAAMERLAQRVVAEGMSVRATEEIAALGGVPAETSKPRVPRAGNRLEAIDNLAVRLSDRFDTRVRISLGKAKGRVSVEFATVEDLNRILTLIAPDDPGLFEKK